MTNAIWKPMLCHNLDKHRSKVVFPCYCQPKLDGIRCLYVPEQGFFSRNGKKITGVPKLEREVSEKMHMCTDGELWCPGKSFQEIASSVRRSTNINEDEAVMYYLFDYISPQNRTYEARGRLLSYTAVARIDRVVVLETVKIDNWAKLSAYLKQCLDRGFEGIIYRNPNGLYEQGKRSFNLMKLKPTLDADVKAVGFVEGTNRLVGSLGAIHVVAEDGTDYYVGTGFTDQQRDEIWCNQLLYSGKMLTVKYQELTDEGRARFPVFVDWRPDLD